MPTYRIPVVWQESGCVLIEADSLEEAADKVESNDDPLPDGDYISCSFKVDRDNLKVFNTENGECDLYGNNKCQNKGS